MSLNIFRLFLLVFLFVIGIAINAANREEKRIYLVDITASMTGVDHNENIFGELKAKLKEEIQSEDSAEFVVITFADKVYDRYIGSPDEICASIDKTAIKWKNTNIYDAWNAGIAELDSTKVCYLYLLTDGGHNVGAGGPTKEDLLDQMRKWEDISKDKYFFAFYVMLAQGGRDKDIRALADSTERLWCIDGMKINAQLANIENTKINVFTNKKQRLYIRSNFPLDSADIAISLIDTTCCYQITKSESNLPEGYIDIYLEQLRNINDIPEQTDVRLVANYDKKKYSLLFFEQDYYNLTIYNCGDRTVNISCDMDFGMIDYSEPYQGPLSDRPKWYQKLIDSFSLLRPDTLIKEVEICYQFNEEATRFHSEVALFFCDEKEAISPFVEIEGQDTNTIILHANSADEKQILRVRVKVNPMIGEGNHTGLIVAKSNSLNKINSRNSIGNRSIIGSWNVDFKYSIPTRPIGFAVCALIFSLLALAAIAWVGGSVAISTMISVLSGIGGALAVGPYFGAGIWAKFLLWLKRKIRHFLIDCIKDQINGKVKEEVVDQVVANFFTKSECLTNKKPGLFNAERFTQMSGTMIHIEEYPNDIDTYKKHLLDTRIQVLFVWGNQLYEQLTKEFTDSSPIDNIDAIETKIEGITLLIYCWKTTEKWKLIIGWPYYRHKMLAVLNIVTARIFKNNFSINYDTAKSFFI